MNLYVRVCSNVFCSVCPQTFRHGFPFSPTALAWDPIQKLLAIGDKGGNLRMYPFHYTTLQYTTLITDASMEREPNELNIPMDFHESHGLYLHTFRTVAKKYFLWNYQPLQYVVLVRRLCQSLNSIQVWCFPPFMFVYRQYTPISAISTRGTRGRHYHCTVSDSDCPGGRTWHSPDNWPKVARCVRSYVICCFQGKCSFVACKLRTDVTFSTRGHCRPKGVYKCFKICRVIDRTTFIPGGIP